MKNHIVIRNEKLFCTNCGGDFKIIYPITPKELQNKTKAFSTLHEDCPATWQEPKNNPEQTIEERALFWISNGSVGLSSKTMWCFFMNQYSYKVYHPEDPDDFSRCYRLLCEVPEWRARILELSVLSPQWEALSTNWDTLTNMFEENEKTNWKKVDEINMLGYMHDLLNFKKIERK